jgi:hypothetical protein
MSDNLCHISSAPARISVGTGVKKAGRIFPNPAWRDDQILKVELGRDAEDFILLAGLV